MELGYCRQCPEYMLFTLHRRRTVMEKGLSLTFYGPIGKLKYPYFPLTRLHRSGYFKIVSKGVSVFRLLSDLNSTKRSTSSPAKLCTLKSTFYFRFHPVSRIKLKFDPPLYVTVVSRNV